MKVILIYIIYHIITRIYITDHEIYKATNETLLNKLKMNRKKSEITGERVVLKQHQLYSIPVISPLSHVVYLIDSTKCIK